MKWDDSPYVIPTGQAAHRDADYRCRDIGKQNNEGISAPAEKERDRRLGGDEKH